MFCLGVYIYVISTYTCFVTNYNYFTCKYTGAPDNTVEGTAHTLDVPGLTITTEKRRNEFTADVFSRTKNENTLRNFLNYAAVCDLFSTCPSLLVSDIIIVGSDIIIVIFDVIVGFSVVIRCISIVVVCTNCNCASTIWFWGS